MRERRGKKGRYIIYLLQYYNYVTGRKQREREKLLVEVKEERWKRISTNKKTTKNYKTHKHKTVLTQRREEIEILI